LKEGIEIDQLFDALYFDDISINLQSFCSDQLGLPSLLTPAQIMVEI